MASTRTLQPQGFPRKTVAKGKAQKKRPRVLFDKSQLKHEWSFSRGIGPGLVNCSNTCFLNSVLECLTYTPSLAQYLLTGAHRKNCSVQGFCAMCSMEKHVDRCFRGPKSNGQRAAILPGYFTANLRAMSKTLRLGRQEDAHEFLMFFLDAMHKATIAGLGKLEPRVEETALLYQIFGGRLQSQLRCSACKAISSTYQSFLDLSVDLHKADTLTKALQNFIHVDRISDYRCDTCKKRVDVGKQMTLCQLPPMLTIHLKRFTYDMRFGFMRKVKTPVQYPVELDMAPYLSKDAARHGPLATTYSLYAVLVHAGSGCDSGHYYAFVKSLDGRWFLMDDDEVTPVSLQVVLKQQAYMLFYAQCALPAKRPLSDKVVADEPVKKAKRESLPAVAPATPPSITSVHMQQVREERLQATKATKTTVTMEAAQVDVLGTKETKSSPTPSVSDESLSDEEEKEHMVISDRPSQWHIRSTRKPFRSLRGSFSPTTFSAAVSDESIWIVRHMDDPAPRKKTSSSTQRWRKRLVPWQVQNIR